MFEIYEFYFQFVSLILFAQSLAAVSNKKGKIE